jgi:hypothetical protein
MNIVKQIQKIGLLTLIAMPAWSATVSLSPSTQFISAPELGGPAVFFQIDVLLDASDVDGFHPAIIDGGYTITFDPDQIEYIEFITGNLDPEASFVGTLPLGPPPSPFNCGTSPACVIVPLIENAPEISTIGSFKFEVKNGVAPGSAIHIGVDNLFLFDDVVSGSFFTNKACPPGISCGNSDFTPDYSGATVNVVPIPAAVWLFASALGALGWSRRRKVPLVQ